MQGPGGDGVVWETQSVSAVVTIKEMFLIDSQLEDLLFAQYRQND